MRRREDNEEKTYFRSDRIFSMNGQWYFGSREGDCGPFVSRESAREALARFVNEKVELDGFQKAREQEPRRNRIDAHAKQMGKIKTPSTLAMNNSELMI